MSIRKVFMTLNVRKAESQTTIEGLHVGDVGSTQLVISLTDGTRAIDLTKFGTVTAIIHGKKPDGYEIHNACTVEGGKIYYTLTAQDTAVSGIVDYMLDVTVNRDEQYERAYMPTFRTRVSDRIYSPAYRELETEPEHWERDYKNYYRKEGNAYIQVDDNVCPTFAPETFYVLVDPPVESASQFLAFFSAFNKVSELFDKRLVIDSTTTDIEYSPENIHKVFINATIGNGIKGVVFTAATGNQYAVCSDGLLRMRTYSGSYSDWNVVALNTVIDDSNKNKNNRVPSIKAVVDYIASAISGKADSADVAASLAGKADVNHTHDMSAYITSTALQSALAGKADTDHTHSQYLTEHQDLSAYALIANVTAALALKADKDTAMKYKDITGSAIYQVNDDLISDKKTIYRVFDGLGWGLLFNLITNQQHTQIILREDGHLLYRQKTVNASWQGVSFTDIFSSYATTAAMTAGLAGKADISHTHDMSNYVTLQAMIAALANKADISDIPSVPTNVSAFDNDAGYITSSDIDLSGKANYREVNIENINNATNPNTVYRVSLGMKDGLPEYATIICPRSGDLSYLNHTQYAFTNLGRVLIRKCINGVWESSFTDLIPEDADVSGKADKSYVDTELAKKADKSEIPSKISAFTNDVGYLTQHQDISGKENTVNKKTSITNQSQTGDSNTFYPTVGAVRDFVNYVKNNTEDYIDEEIENIGSAKADKATTLAGYGITNAYTKAEVDAAISAAIGGIENGSY